MSIAHSDEPIRQKPLRLWPGVVIVALQWLGRFVVPRFGPDAAFFGVMIGVFGGLLALLVWWAFFSRATRAERWGAVILMIVALVSIRPLLHVSVRTGSMGMLVFYYAIPTLSLAFVVWAAASRRLSAGTRLATMVATILLACGVWTLVRNHGISFDGADLSWRWAQTAEERLLARGPDAMTAPGAHASAAGAIETGAAWPGFRGLDRTGVVPGVSIETDWSSSPPAELWRRPIGPGASSLAVHGDLLYTQEQRGEEEVVSCYRLATGEPVWRHSDAARFWDPYVDAGPRATPTLSGGRVYSFGATGILNALDAGSGAVVWSRNATSDTGAEIPFWGFASSPLVVDDFVIVHADSLVAYDAATGDKRWAGSAVGETYSSPHLLTLDGVPQILLLTLKGVISVAPADGALLWEHAWPGIGVVQPAAIGDGADGDVLISTSNMAAMPIGTRRLSVTLEGGGWTAEEIWTSKRLKPSFSSVVVHQGHAYGFDGNHLAAIDVEDGTRTWKGGRYGSGQVLLLPDQNLLLVVSERGELALVEAKPEIFTELARFRAIEGKTWSQPTLVGDVLVVRNGEEMAAFRLALAAG